MADPILQPRTSDQAAARRTPARRGFAVLVPAYDEFENIAALVNELRSAFQRHDLDGEVILVDDGSADGTADEARRVAGDWDRFRVVSHRRQFGKTEAILTGAAATDADVLVLFDADLQHSPDEIPRFLDKIGEGWDVVTGRKVGPYDKRVVSSVYNRLNRSLFRIPVSDLNSMKAFRRRILDEVHLRHDWHRFFVVLAYDRGFSVSEIDIELFPRRAGTPKYSGQRRIVVGLLDLLSVAFFLFFARKPMLLFGLSGLSLAGLGIIVGIVTIALRIQGIMPPFGFRPLLYFVILLETVGFLLFGFGFLAELIAQQRAELDALYRRIRTPDQTTSRTPSG